MPHRIASMVVLVGGVVLVMSGESAAQGVTGSGTPGTVPVWTADGTVLTDSHVQDNGTNVTVQLPLAVSGTVSGTTSGGPGFAGVAGFNSEATVGGVGVTGTALGPHGVGVSGEADGDITAVGVFGFSSTGIGVGGRATGTSITYSAGVFGESDGVGPGVVAISSGSGPALDVRNFGSSFYAGIVGGNFLVNGDAFKPGGGSWSDMSDVRVKKSIEPIHDALHQLLQLRGVTYEFKDPEAIHELPGTHIGMVAQEVEPVFPSWVDTGKDGYKRLTFRGFEAVTVEAVRELDVNSKAALDRIADLERQNAELRHALKVLSETVKALQQTGVSRTSE